MAGKGGKRENAGRKTKAEEMKANVIMTNALKKIYSKETDEDARFEFIKELHESERGKMFIAEHIFGKAPQEVKNTNFNYDSKDLTTDEIKAINKALENAY